MRLFSTARLLARQSLQSSSGTVAACALPCGAAGAWFLSEKGYLGLPAERCAKESENSLSFQIVRPFADWSSLLLHTAGGVFASSFKALNIGTFGTPVQCESIAAAASSQAAGIGAAAKSANGWPVISLEEVQKHITPDSVWVTHEGGVYDVTKFIHQHPGGSDLLLSAAGLDMAPFWDCYKVHGRSDYARGFLEAYKIGELTPEDAAKAKEDWNGQHAKAIARGKEIARRRWLPIMAVMVVMPYLFILRKLVQILGLFVPPLATWVADFLPISVPGYGSGTKRFDPKKSRDGKKLRVAVIGGGISGCSCAWALHTSGFETEIYEARAKIGGNARTVEWSKKGEDGEPVRTDVTVLFWCPEFYKNYTALLKKIGANFHEFWMPYILHSNMRGKSEFFTCNEAPGHKHLEPNLRDRYAADLRVWDRVVKVVRFFEYVTCMDTRPSYYKQGGWLAMINPFNFVTAEKVCRWAGMSQECWDEIIDPLHALNLSQNNMSNTPAVVMSLLDETAPINHTRRGVSWGVGNSDQVFKKLTEKVKVHTWTRVLGVDVKPTGELLVFDDQGEEKEFDRVVFACPASACASMIRPAGWLEERLLRAIRYEDDESRSFMQAVVHEDPNVLPEAGRKEMLRDGTFLIDVTPDKETGRPLAEITHNMGTWPPVFEACGGKLNDGIMSPPPGHDENPPAMIVTHCMHPGKKIDESKVILRHDYGRSHPSLKMSNLIVTSLMPLVQGRRGMYYASNWVCPGNGHDLSCISGLSAASSIGADYPFPENKLAQEDFERFRRMLGMDENQRFPWFVGLGVAAATTAICSS